METKIINIDPKEIKLLELNARFMKTEDFRQLVKNVKRDGCLTQLPFCCKDKDGRWLVLSGNHRVQASVEAGLKKIKIQVTEDNLSKDERIGIQLSHNAISGQDDMAVLKQLYEMIDDVSYKDYSGLDDETLELLDKVNASSMSSASLEYQVINMAFLPNETKGIAKCLKNVKEEIGKNITLTARMAEYDKFLDTLNDVSKAKLIKNTSVAFIAMLDIVNKNLGSLREECLTEAKDKDYVPINMIVDRGDMKAEDARVLNKAIDKLISENKVDKMTREKALSVLAKEYLGEKVEKIKKKK